MARKLFYKALFQLGFQLERTDHDQHEDGNGTGGLKNVDKLHHMVPPVNES